MTNLTTSEPEGQFACPICGAEPHQLVMRHDIGRRFVIFKIVASGESLCGFSSAPPGKPGEQDGGGSGNRTRRGLGGNPSPAPSYPHFLRGGLAENACKSFTVSLPLARLLVACLLGSPGALQMIPTPDQPPWIEWHGGECPVAPDAWVQIRLRDGTPSEGIAGRTPTGTYRCKHLGNAADIVAYRVNPAHLFLGTWGHALDVESRTAS